MTRISLEQVIDAIEMATQEVTYYYDVQTGETVYLANLPFFDESGDELAERIETSPERYFRFPAKYDINEHHIMRAFIKELPEGRPRYELADAIRGKGAFKRFKSGIRYHRLEQAWYRYQADAYREIAIHWCEDNGFAYED